MFSDNLEDKSAKLWYLRNSRNQPFKISQIKNTCNNYNNKLENAIPLAKCMPKHERFGGFEDLKQLYNLDHYKKSSIQFQWNFHCTLKSLSPFDVWDKRWVLIRPFFEVSLLIEFIVTVVICGSLQNYTSRKCLYLPSRYAVDILNLNPTLV